MVATVRDAETGQAEKIKCQYLVGCDGGMSWDACTCLDIRYDGIARVAQLYMVHFRSDARDVLQPWGVAWHYQTSQATMIAQNDRDIWNSAHVSPARRPAERNRSFGAGPTLRGTALRIRDPRDESLEPTFARFRELRSWTGFPRG